MQYESVVPIGLDMNSYQQVRCFLDNLADLARKSGTTWGDMKNTLETN